MGSNLATVLQLRLDQVTLFRMTLISTLRTETKVLPVHRRPCWIWPLTFPLPFALLLAYSTLALGLLVACGVCQAHSRLKQALVAAVPLAWDVFPSGNRSPFSLAFSRSLHELSFWRRPFLTTPLELQPLLLVPIFPFFL